MRNKKGILLSQGIKIILTVLAILLLIYLAGKLMGILVKNQIPDCNVDSENMVLNAPCNCGSFGVIGQKKLTDDGKKVLVNKIFVDFNLFLNTEVSFKNEGKSREVISLELCKDGEYCYEDIIGCSEKRLERKSEKVKIGDIIEYSLDPFYEVYSTRGINAGKNFAEIKFKKYGNRNGLEILSLRNQKNYYEDMFDEGFNSAKVQQIQGFIVDFKEKSEEFKVLVRELNKICDDYMLLMPQGVIYNAADTDKAILTFGPSKRNAFITFPINTPWNKQFATDWKEVTKKISYGADLGLTDVDFEIKLKLPDSCFK